MPPPHLFFCPDVYDMCSFTCLILVNTRNGHSAAFTWITWKGVFYVGGLIVLLWWHQGLKVSRLNKLLRKSRLVMRLEMWRQRQRRGLKTILDSPSHPLYSELWQMGSSFSLQIISFRWKKRCFSWWFVPTATGLNSSSGKHWLWDLDVKKKKNLTHIVQYNIWNR